MEPPPVQRCAQRRPKTTKIARAPATTPVAHLLHSSLLASHCFRLRRAGLHVSSEMIEGTKVQINLPEHIFDE